MQIVEFPGHVVDASEDVELSFVVIDAVAVSDIRNFSRIGESMVFIIVETEHPAIVEPR